MPSQQVLEKAEAKFNQGKNAQQQENIEQSLESYQKAIELNPNSLPILSKLAELHRNQKQYRQAFTYYLKIVSLRPKNPIFFENLVTISLDYSKFLLKKNDLDRAFAVYQEFLHQKPFSNTSVNKIDRICHILGEIILKLTVRQGQFTLGINFFQESIEKLPYKGWSYYHLGKIFGKQKKLDQAIACYREVVLMRPKFPLGFLSLGELLLRKGCRKQAFECAINILEIMLLPKNQRYFLDARVNKNFVRLLSVHPNQQKTQEALQKAVEQMENSNANQQFKIITYRNIGKILRDRGKSLEAIDFYQKSLYLSLQQSRPKFVEQFWEVSKLQEPDFLVIGFGKCGTTAFYDYLCQHPQVLPAVEKEPMYLYHGLIKLQDFESRNWSLPSPEKALYLAHFPPKPEGNRFITGEASTNNIVSGCDEVISSWFPKIKLIVILREPVRRTISHYEELLKLGAQNRSLKEIINSELEEFEASTNISQTVAEKLKRGWREHIAMSLYVYSLERWMKLFPREQFLILTNEELAQKPKETMKQAFDFLEIPQCNSITYHPKNVGSYPQVDDDLLLRLSNFFRPHNQKLEKFLGRKFDWDNSLR